MVYLRLERLSGSSGERRKRNNNIIIVKCFISSFGGERIHQFQGEGGRGAGTWYRGPAERGSAAQQRHPQAGAGRAPGALSGST